MILAFFSPRAKNVDAKAVRHAQLPEARGAEAAHRRLEEVAAQRLGRRPAAV